jgi:regulator of replication initiation timing
VEPYEIEDTSDWLGSPTRLESVKHYASMLEEDVQNLKRQLQAAKENISSLVEMNDQLSAERQKKRAWMANLEAETTEQLAQIRSLTLVLDQKERIIRELQMEKPTEETAGFKLRSATSTALQSRSRR